MIEVLWQIKLFNDGAVLLQLGIVNCAWASVKKFIPPLKINI
jgi:hypothetical protein